jgi:protein-S-isoprenylcysteine O-methyltransferase Ste14
MHKVNILKQTFVFFQFVSILILVIFGNVLVWDWGLLLQVLAVFIGIWAIKSVGKNNWSVYPVPNDESSIASGGIYKFIRHPMYLAVLLFCWPIALRSLEVWALITALVLTGTLVLKIFYEERLLEEKHTEYKSLFSKTKRLIPFVW